jgi:hypothetical protein
VIERAIASAAPKARYTVEVRVLPRSQLAASLVVDGHALPEQHFAVMDGELKPSSIRRFAEALGNEVANAGSH